MKLKIEIPKIHCKRKTREIFDGKDEIYYAIFLTAGKIKDGDIALSDKAPNYGIIAPDSKKMHHKEEEFKFWIPEMQNNIVELDNDVEFIHIDYALYEKDKGETYEKMKNELNGIVIPNGLDWDSIIAEIKKFLLEEIIGKSNKEEIKQANSIKKLLSMQDSSHKCNFWLNNN